MNATPVNGRGTRDDPTPATSRRQKNVKVKAKRRQDSKPEKEDGEEEEESRAEELIREAVEEVSALAEPEKSFLHLVREAVEAFARRYCPLHNAMQGVGSSLKSTEVGQYPEPVRKLKKEMAQTQKEVERCRKETSKLAVLAVDRKEELKRQKEIIRSLEQQDRTMLKVFSEAGGRGARKVSTQTPPGNRRDQQEGRRRPSGQ